MSTDEERLTRRAKLLEEAKKLPTTSGVYLMRSEHSQVLYVGKAKSLRSRVSQYFQPAQNDSVRIELLVGNIHTFDVVLTETESEALILECTLIKKHKPKFNVRLKDDKAYPYIKIPMDVDFPRLIWTRRVLSDGARYFGPFPSAWSARQVLQLLNETFLLRDCNDNTFRHRSRPCLLYQMERCSAPCVGKIEKEPYRHSIDSAIEVLEGKGSELIRSLQSEMQTASEAEDYELAALYRDQMQNVELITQTQGVVQAEVATSRDIVAVARDGIQAQGTFLQVRGGILVSVRHYLLQNVEPLISDGQILFDLLSQHYLSHFSEKIPASAETTATSKHAHEPPREILLEQVPEDLDLLEEALAVRIRVPETKEEEQLCHVARANADHALEFVRSKHATHGMEAVDEVQRKLHLDRPPIRIECYDISNTGGEESVASRVVFMNGEPDKNLYRRYKIKTVEGANDFASMREVLGRRFSRIEDTFPDLVVVDGGRGQLSQALSIFEELNIQGVPVVGLAKSRVKRDFKAKEVESSDERIFLPNRKNPVVLRTNTAAFRLLTHVRDEAHRFAINYHRKRRQKASLKSEG